MTQTYGIETINDLQQKECAVLSESHQYAENHPAEVTDALLAKRAQHSETVAKGLLAILKK